MNLRTATLVAGFALFSLTSRQASAQTQPLVTRLLSADPNRALFELRDGDDELAREVVPALLEAMTSSVPVTRCRATQALAMVGERDERAGSAIATGVADTDRLVRLYSIAAARHVLPLQPPLERALVVASKHEDWSTRLFAVEALGDHVEDSSGPVQALLAARNDPDSEIRLRASIALERARKWEDQPEDWNSLIGGPLATSAQSSEFGYPGPGVQAPSEVRKSVAYDHFFLLDSSAAIHESAMQTLARRFGRIDALVVLTGSSDTVTARDRFFAVDEAGRITAGHLIGVSDDKIPASSTSEYHYGVVRFSQTTETTPLAGRIALRNLTPLMVGRINSSPIHTSLAGMRLGRRFPKEYVEFDWPGSQSRCMALIEEDSNNLDASDGIIRCPNWSRKMPGLGGLLSVTDADADGIIELAVLSVPHYASHSIDLLLLSPAGIIGSARTLWEWGH